MLRNMRRAPLVVLLVGGLAVMFSNDKTGHWFTLGLMAVSVSIGVASILGVIYFQFRNRSVKALIWTQGLEMTCILWAVLLFIYVSVYETPLYSKAPLYFLLSYPLLAVLAMIYGRRYAVKRWGPRAEWLGEYARSYDTVPSSVLYEKFFANPDPNMGKKVVFWVGISVPATMILRYRYGDDGIGIVVSVLMTWASFAMFSNLFIRSRLIRTFLGKRDIHFAD